ncbi:hypothetical protein [Ornithinimicrobium faecis]|uniref:Uncharacterized protein n=1 Tax=Ornithinimicrobium faecis TaxID=2934158 RepID=A0ABY4YTJ6_9MICO|nr:MULTISPECIES: hypothetical protein [unclassified Ornithinimicrobium]USQ79907.1 hypothetical protein NF556_20360 [Ornithinimicrobium sp. HY1793]
MWINPMLTIWLYGTIFSLVLIVFTLWLWYWRNPGDDHTGHVADQGAEAQAADRTDLGA